MRNPVVEQWLMKQGVEFKYVAAIPLSRFNVKRSLANQARLDPKPVNDDTVIEYGLALDEGYDLPAVVGWRDADEQVVLADGNNRLAAMIDPDLHPKRKIESIDAYIIESSDPRIIDTITRTINVTNGMRPTREQMVEQAVTMVARDGLTMKEAAARAGVPQGAVQRAMTVRRGRERIASLDMDPSAFNDTTVMEIAKIKSQPVQQAALNVVRDGALGTTAVQSLVRDILAKESDGEQAMLNSIGRFRNDPVYKNRVALTRRGASPRPLRGGDKRLKFLQMLTDIEKTLDGAKTLADFGITLPKERDSINRRWIDIRGRMQAVLRG